MKTENSKTALHMCGRCGKKVSSEDASCQHCGNILLADERLEKKNIPPEKLSSPKMCILN